MHEFDKVELFAYATPEGALDAQADILRRAESMLQELELPYRVLDLCAGDLGGLVGADVRPGGLRARRRSLARGVLGQLVPRLPGPAGQRALPPGRGGGPLQLVHTVNGSALAWPRIWAALVETGRQEDGTVHAARGAGAVSRRRAADQGAVSGVSGPSVGGVRGDSGRFGYDRMLEAIAAESRRLRRRRGAARTWMRRVPSCPKWSVRDLAHHIGEVQWYWGRERARAATPTRARAAT